MNEEARKRDDADALARIAAIGPPPFTVEEELAIQGFVDRYGGYWRDRPNLFLLAARAGGSRLISGAGRS